MRLEVEGLEKLKKLDAPYLICPNHQSFLDPFVVCSNYPFDVFRKTFHVGAAMFFKGAVMRFVASMVKVVPIDPDTQLMRAMKAGAIGLKNGKILNIYPEGERAFDGKLHDFKKGAAIIASELDLIIVPVALDGLYNVWARGSWKIRPAKVKIKIGDPISARAVADALTASDAAAEKQSELAAVVSDEQRYEHVTAHLKATIADMIADLRR